MTELLISNFSSLLELFVVLNFSYVSFEGVSDFINCKIFGLNNKLNTLKSEIIVDIEETEVLIESPEKEYKNSHLEVAQENLNILHDNISPKVKAFQKGFRGIYLLAGYYSVFLIFIGAYGKDSYSNLNNLTPFLYILFLGLFIKQLFFKGLSERTAFLHTALFIGVIIINSLLVNFNLIIFKGLSNNYQVLSSITLLIIPFILNYIGTLYIYYLLQLDSVGKKTTDF